MKEKNATKERSDPAVAGRQSEDNPVSKRDEPIHRNARQGEKKMHASDMNNRARKSYHNDGPGGNYAGY